MGHLAELTEQNSCYRMQFPTCTGLYFFQLDTFQVHFLYFRHMIMCELELKIGNSIPAQAKKLCILNEYKLL